MTLERADTRRGKRNVARRENKKIHQASYQLMDGVREEGEDGERKRDAAGVSKAAEEKGNEENMVIGE